MRFLISVLENTGEKKTREDIIWSFDTVSRTAVPFILPQLKGMPKDLGHARGMTIVGNNLVIGFHLKTQKDALFIAPLYSLDKGAWIPLSKTKEIHSITSLNDDTLALNSTGTDDLVYVSFDPDKLEMISEEVVKHFGEKGSKDAWHFNSICFDDGVLYATAFRDAEKYPGEGKKPGKSGSKSHGILMVIKPTLHEHEVVMEDLCQPHSVCISRDNIICFCESGDNIVSFGGDRYTVKGYCRGMAEDTFDGGFWVGISAHRHGQKAHGAMVNTPGAGVQFIDSNGQTGDFVDLQHIGPEIFDLQVIPDDVRDGSA